MIEGDQTRIHRSVEVLRSMRGGILGAETDAAAQAILSESDGLARNVARLAVWHEDPKAVEIREVLDEQIPDLETVYVPDQRITRVDQLSKDNIDVLEYDLECMGRSWPHAVDNHYVERDQSLPTHETLLTPQVGIIVPLSWDLVKAHAHEVHLTEREGLDSFDIIPAAVHKEDHSVVVGEGKLPWEAYTHVGTYVDFNGSGYTKNALEGSLKEIRQKRK